jgi:hypothetical protein
MQSTTRGARASAAHAAVASLLVAFLALTATGPAANAAEAVSETLVPDRSVVPGEKIVIKGKNLPPATNDVTVVIQDKYLVPVTDANGTSLSFVIPPEAAHGTYSLAIRTGNVTSPLLAHRVTVVAPTLQIAADTRLPDAMPEHRVQIKGKDFPTQRGNLQVLLDKRPPITPEEAAADSITFRVPSDTPPARYNVVLETTVDPKRSATVPGELRVVPKAAPKITAVKPITGYPGGKDRYDFELTGENFAAEAKDNSILINGSAIAGRNDEPCKAKPLPPDLGAPCVAVGADGRTLSIYEYDPKKLHGPAKVQVQAHGLTSNEQTMLFSRIAREDVLPLAIVGSILITGILIALVWNGLRHYKIGGLTYSPFAVFFLDKATHTYSLSKFQLFAWTSAAVFGYLYLLIANLLVQWKFALPDLPDGLPLLMGISAGTTVTAIGITNQFGGKGSGPVRPSVADFITSGGLIAPERFQFFVWTVVGIMGFISLLLVADPATLNALPKLPENFVTIMGISSAAYLGGKAVRKGGPNIRTFSIKAVTPKGATKIGEDEIPKTDRPHVGPYMTINLKGENLDSKGTIKVDDKVLRTDQFWIVARLRPEPPSTMSAEVDAHLDLGLIDEANPNRLLEGQHDLALVNSDGQSASIRFPLDGLTIEEPKPRLVRAGANATIKVTGRNFAEQMDALWKASATAAEVCFEATPPTKTEPQQTTVNLPAGHLGTGGAGTLTLKSKLGLRASTAVTVVPQRTIGNVQPSPVPMNTKATLIVSGTALSGITSAKWKPAGGAAEVDAKVTPSGQDVKVEVENTGPKGAATLKLIDELGEAATAPVTVQ